MQTRGAVVANATLFYCAAVAAEQGILVVNIIDTQNVPLPGILIGAVASSAVDTDRSEIGRMRDVGAPTALVHDSPTRQRLRGGSTAGGAQR